MTGCRPPQINALQFQRPAEVPGTSAWQPARKNRLQVTSRNRLAAISQLVADRTPRVRHSQLLSPARNFDAADVAGRQHRLREATDRCPPELETFLQQSQYSRFYRSGRIASIKTAVL